MPEAFTFAFGLPPILGLSPTGGFQFMLEDRAGGDIATLARAADTLVGRGPQAARAGERDQHLPRRRARATRSTWTPTSCRRWAFR